MIKSRVDANKYYSLVNDYIDSYVEKWKISPSKLKRYLNPAKITKFIERHGLKEIVNIQRVIDDVVDDRIAIEKDHVMRFESFINESVSNNSLFKGIDKVSIIHEQILADIFDTSLSNINIVNSNKHIFQVEGLTEDVECIIFTKDEITILIENLTSILKDNLNKKTIKIDIEGVDFEIQLSNIEVIEKDFTFLSKENIHNTLKRIFKCSSYKKSEHYIGLCHL